MKPSAVSDLPHPDSPTMHKVSPRSTWKDTPCTAWSWPAGTGSVTRRSSTVSTRSPMRISTAVLGRGHVTQAVAQHVDGQHQQEQSDAGDRDQPGIEEHETLGFGDHEPPRRRWRLYAKPQE